MSKIDILGVKVDNVSMNEAVIRVEEMLADGKKHQIVTPNPEFVMLAQKDEEFREILNQADLAIPDGVGLVWASKILGRRPQGLGDSILRERVTGTDLMLKLCEIACQKGWTVFLLGGGFRVSRTAARYLLEQFPDLRIAGTSSASPFSDLRPPTSDLLFVAYGAPTQEKWIAENLAKIPAKVAIGVGGAFDFIVGKQKRAPQFIQNLGLEWLWRLLRQPWRARRQLALVKFAVLIFWQKAKEMV